MAKKLRPWWTGQQWVVKAVAIRAAPSGAYKRGDWIEIYSTETKTEAQALAKQWSEEHKTPTLVEPGAGHSSRRES